MFFWISFNGLFVIIILIWIIKKDNCYYGVFGILVVDFLILENFVIGCKVL